MKSRWKVEPSHVVAEAAREAFIKAEGGHRYGAVRLLWEVPGPKDTRIAWLSFYAIGTSVCLVQTYDDGTWDALTANDTLDVKETIADVFRRCGVPVV